jgi:hypothetical protein
MYEPPQGVQRPRRRLYLIIAFLVILLLLCVATFLYQYEPSIVDRDLADPPTREPTRTLVEFMDE